MEAVHEDFGDKRAARSVGWRIRRSQAWRSDRPVPPVMVNLLIGHLPSVATTDEAMKHASLVGVIALLYVAWQAGAILEQPRGGAMPSLVKILVSLLFYSSWVTPSSTGSGVEISSGCS